MKKTWLIIMMTMIAVAPLVGMEKKSIIQFMGDPVVSIKESNLCLIKTLHKHYKQHQNATKSGGIVPRYEHVSEQAIALVNDALNVRPDKFADFYQKQLTPFGRELLTKASGQYDEHGKRVMLDVPEITKRLIDVYFTDDGLCTYIKSFLKNEDEDYARNYFKEQLIYSKRSLMLKQPMFGTGFSDKIRNDIYLGSLFINGHHTVKQYECPVPLYTGDKVRQMYATYFAIDNYEYRITDMQNNQCLLWVINHDNPEATFSTLIKHKGNIKGCCFSSTQTDVEGVLTYSDYDMVFSTITTHNGLSFVESVFIDSPNLIVDACFDPNSNNWLVGVYKDLNSVVRRWTMQGEFSKEGEDISFKKYGLLEKIAIYQASPQQYQLIEMFTAAGLYSTYICEAVSDGSYHAVAFTGLMSVGSFTYHSDGNRWLLSIGDSVGLFDLRAPFFVNEQNGSFFDSLYSQPDSRVHRVYSPDGAFLMCNSLKKKLGILYVETVLSDAVTHKKILSIDTLYKGFIGVGFTHDGTELMFLDDGSAYSTVSLLNYEDKQVLSEIDDIVCSNLGVASLVKRLCQQCKENSILALQKDDSTRTMLMDWSKKSPMLLKLLEKCLPIAKVTK